jgi:predicted nucleic acid-binding protein
MADVVLDANVLVGYLDANDVHHARAASLVDRVEAAGHRGVLLDVIVAEAVSVLCRRARERKANPPDLSVVLRQIRSWHDAGEIEPSSQDRPRFFGEVLDVVEATKGVLNFNDAILVVLQRDAVIDDVASFDEGFDVVPGFRRLS